MGFQTCNIEPLLSPGKWVGGKICTNYQAFIVESTKRWEKSIYQPLGTVDNLASPAQLLMNRWLKSIIPTNPQQLTSKVVDPNQGRSNRWGR